MNLELPLILTTFAISVFALKKLIKKKKKFADVDCSFIKYESQQQLRTDLY